MLVVIQVLVDLFIKKYSHFKEFVEIEIGLSVGKKLIAVLYLVFIQSRVSVEATETIRIVSS